MEDVILPKLHLYYDGINIKDLNKSPLYRTCIILKLKKRNTVIIAILLFMLVINLIGCKKEQPENLKTAVTEETSNSEISENIEDNVENENLEDELKFFECMEEIKEASPESGLVQVDDMILQYGCKVSDVIENIENSNSSFE